MKARDNFLCLAGRAVEGAREEWISAGIGRSKIGGAQEGFHRVVVFAEGVVGHAQANGHARRIGKTIGTLAKDFDGGFECTVEKEFAAPVEDVAFTGVHVGGGLEFLDGRNKVAGFLFDFREEVVELGGVFLLEESLDELAGVGKAIGEEISEGKVVAVVVYGRIGELRALEIGDGFPEFAGAGVEFAEIVIGVVGVGFEGEGLFELRLGKVGLAEVEKIVAEIGARGGGIGLEAHGLFEVIVGLVVERLRGVDEAEEFVDLEALGELREELFELGGGFGVMAGFVLGDSGLEFLVEIFLLSDGNARLRSAGEKSQESGGHKRSPDSHDGIMVAPGHRETLRAKKAGKELLAKRLPGGV